MHEPATSQYAGQQSYESQSHNPLRRGGQQGSVPEAAVEFFTQYARERPEVVAMWAFGIGFLLGWKLKPW